MIIGDTLKKLRMIYGFTAKEMSAELEISPSYLSEIENNKKEPSLDILKKYSNILDIKLSSLLLFSEQYSDSEKDGEKWIRNKMAKLINSFSKEND
ncbi:helix-turn-helix domain-containing protein [Enterococcus mundtii]|uniref:helix-turn-helix domain-containing protein n=1 Tax=Enterococcus mundtii TaxID=53346 RepID=UPI00044C89A2|nr:helix-turn-helix transcriptional regulator [Enterococcus mundtii]EYT94599.1 DNA-binding protein [Enterococcus mundtii CRL35]